MNFRRRVGRYVLCAACMVTVLAMQARAQEPFRIFPSARFLLGMDWSVFRLSGDMLVPAGGRPGSGSRLDIFTELGVEWSEAASVTLTGTILDRHLVDVDFMMSTPSGVRRSPHSFRFQNKTYEAGTLVETHLDFNWLRCSYGYKLLELPSRWLAPRIGLHWVRFGATLNGDTKEAGSISNTRRLDGTFPVLGFEAGYQLPLGMGLRMELEGMHLFTRGYLLSAGLWGSWEVYPDIVLTCGAFNRIANWAEDHQKLNNEWSFNFSGISAGVSFGF